MGRRRNQGVRARLHETYCTQPQIGLVLGAGVSVASHVPDYLSLALRVFELAEASDRLRSSSSGARSYLSEQAREDGAEPDEILEFIRRAFTGDAIEFQQLVRQALFEKVQLRSHRMVASSTYRDNATLDAVISFCAAEPGAAHAGAKQSVRVAVNRRVGGILTTNYDNLVEGSFGSKFGKSKLLRPVGRPPISYRPGTIPVYHCHGYISYSPPKEGSSGVEASDLVIAQQDYFSAFYDLLGFGNVVATNFLRRLPSLFIGSAMTDRNIRRVLYQIRAESIGASSDLEHFAILKRSGARDELEDAVLESYGVSVVRVADHGEIPDILRDLYLSPAGVKKKDWDWVRRGRSRSKAS